VYWIVIYGPESELQGGCDATYLLGDRFRVVGIFRVNQCDAHRYVHLASKFFDSRNCTWQMHSAYIAKRKNGVLARGVNFLINK